MNKATTKTEPPIAAETIKTRWCFPLKLSDETLGLGPSAGAGTDDGVIEAARGGAGANRGTIDGDGAGDGENGDGDGGGALCTGPGLTQNGGTKGPNG